jgi:TolB-like protein
LGAWQCDAVTTEQDRAPLSSEVKRLEGEVGPHAHHPLLHLPFLEQLKQRNVFRVAVLYLVVCWLILDPLHVVFHMLDVPVWANRLVLMLMAVGFPAAVIFAWVYEITPEGLKPTVEVLHHQSIRKVTGRRLDRAIIAVLAVALAYFVVDKFWISKHFPATQPATPAAQATAQHATVGSAADFAPPAHSIAVLPFVNISGDQEQEYFSEGLTEELLNSLSRINELQVAARTSSFYFKGEHADLATIAHKLNVASVLEGSVRRSGHTVRITAQLNNAVTGFHLWSQTYDRDLSDVLALQTEIANAVAGALKVTLLGDVAAKIEVGGTRNAAAFDAYLRALKVDEASQSEGDFQTAVAGYTEAIRLDPEYALAFAARSLALTSLSRNFATGPAIRDSHARAQADARKAIALAPELAEGHLALAALLADDLEFTRALGEYRRALTLEPGNARVLSNYGRFAVEMGQTEAGLAAVHRSVALDPLNAQSQEKLGESLVQAHRLGEAIATLKEAKSLAPDDVWITAWLGFAYGLSGDVESAREVCESIKIVDDFNRLLCLVFAYDSLGRHADAEKLFTQMRASSGERPAVFYAMVYAHRGDTARALEWLETAMRHRDPYLIRVKVNPGLDPLRKEPRFQAIERELKFPD